MLTQLSPVEAIDALWHAHQDVIGGYCPQKLLAMLAAQSALETGRWHSMHAWNFGNIRGSGDAGSIAIAGADEIVNGQRVTGPEVEKGFAAYSSKYAGARAFVRFLGVAEHPPKPNRYQAAWDAAARGDVGAYVHGLKAAGYFTAPEDRYRLGVEGCLQWIMSGPMPDFLAQLKAYTDGTD